MYINNIDRASFKPPSTMHINYILTFALLPPIRNPQLNTWQFTTRGRARTHKQTKITKTSTAVGAGVRESATVIRVS